MLETDGWRAARWAALLLLPPLAWILFTHGDHFTLYQVRTQDLAILLALPALLLALQRWSPAWKLPDRAPRALPLLAIGVLLILLLGWGSHTLMGDFPISRDEEMVVFDMAVFDKWRLAAPLAPEWRIYAEALVPAFLLNSGVPTGMVSDYLPVNAMLRLAFSKIADPAFYNPMLVVLGGAALLDIARREFDEDRRALWVTLIVYATSAQMLVTSMTTYAMTGHMALNLVWLAAFLRGGRGGHAVAIAAGFLAVGLHQFVFHPLFVAPVLLWRLLQGGWRIVLLYALAYAAILGWWLTYPMIAALQTGVTAVGGGATDDALIEKALPLLLSRDPSTFPSMTLNLMRFVAWQNLALLPLLAAAIPFAWRSRGLAAPLVWGIAGMLLFVTIVLPYQGHGWGYRYLHGYLGSFALLAGFGYRRLAGAGREKADGMVLALTALTLVVSIPLLLYRTWGFVAPHVALERVVAAKPGDFVLIDTDVVPSTDGRWLVNAIDHVRNEPDLTNRPLRFSSRHMDIPALQELCRRGSVSLVTRADMHAAGFALNSPLRSPRFEAMVAPLRGQPCLLR